MCRERFRIAYRKSITSLRRLSFVRLPSLSTSRSIDGTPTSFFHTHSIPIAVQTSVPCSWILVHRLLCAVQSLILGLERTTWVTEIIASGNR